MDDLRIPWRFNRSDPDDQQRLARAVTRYRKAGANLSSVTLPDGIVLTVATTEPYEDHLTKLD